MKTPRQVLLEEHASADLRLEEIQRKAMAAELEHRRKGESLRKRLASFAALFWSEIVRPAKPIWAGFGVAWLIVIAGNMPTWTAAPRVEKSARTAVYDMVAWRDWQRVLAELPSPAQRDPADRVQPTARPRSERRTIYLIG